MTEELTKCYVEITKASAEKSDVITRSTVAAKASYQEYRNELRRDFFYSCAYCTMSEFEAQAIRFCIDHYRPKSLSPELETVYDNLLYCCDACNVRKGSKFPSDEAFNAGYRFFRPDIDSRTEHFNPNGMYIDGLTTEGEFTVQNLDLNRQMIRRVRDMRKRLADCANYISHGVLGLLKFPIDQLPPNIRTRARQTIVDAAKANAGMQNDFDEFLRAMAKSEVLGDDDAIKDIEHDKERRQKLKEMNAIIPNLWKKAGS